MTIPELLSGTSVVLPKTFYRFVKYDIELLNKDESLGTNSILYSFNVYGSSRGKVFTTHLFFYGGLQGNQPTLKSHLRVSCNCEAYRFFWKNADYENEAHFGKIDAWGKVRGVVRNPDQIPGICKHIMACLYGLCERNEVVGGRSLLSYF